MKTIIILNSTAILMITLQQVINHMRMSELEKKLSKKEGNLK